VHSRKKYFSATEIGDSVAVIEALDIRPVLLSCGRLHAVQRRTLNLTLEHLRKYLVWCRVAALLTRLPSGKVTRTGGAFTPAT
jgi:hypothetical protein